MAATSENPPCFLRLPQVKQRTALSRSSIYAKIARGNFRRLSVSVLVQLHGSMTK